MPTESETSVRLQIGHVLFMDLVGYSTLLLDEQRQYQEQLAEVVNDTEQVRSAKEAGKLIRLPAGDGMALVFFDSPEAPVRCAMEISKKLKEYPQLKLRMGVHSGPIDEVRDVNDRPNVAGAGINLARRVMDWGDGGHILLSKRVAEDLAHSRQWGRYLHDLGECAGSAWLGRLIELDHDRHESVRSTRSASCSHRGSIGRRIVMGRRACAPRLQRRRFGRGPGFF